MGLYWPIQHIGDDIVIANEIDNVIYTVIYNVSNKVIEQGIAAIGHFSCSFADNLTATL
ncbi:MAG: hypothetical protein ACJASB_000987 [Shewanella psychromarinicola]|jgi:hypothetical protein